MNIYAKYKKVLPWGSALKFKLFPWLYRGGLFGVDRVRMWIFRWGHWRIDFFLGTSRKDHYPPLDEGESLRICAHRYYEQGIYRTKDQSPLLDIRFAHSGLFRDIMQELELMKWEQFGSGMIHAKTVREAMCRRSATYRGDFPRLHRN